MTSKRWSRPAPVPAPDRDDRQAGRQAGRHMDSKIIDGEGRASREGGRPQSAWVYAQAGVRACACDYARAREKPGRLAGRKVKAGRLR
jgi:hypothetical protein